MRLIIALICISVFYCFNTTAAVLDSNKTVPDTLIIKTEDIGPAVNAAIKSGNAKKLAAYFNTTIQLSVPGNNGTYGKSQAEFIMKDFFSTHPPSSFSINNQGNSKTSSYYIGTYSSGSKSFRTYYSVKNIGGKEVIHVLKFE